MLSSYVWNLNKTQPLKWYSTSLYLVQTCDAYDMISCIILLNLFIFVDICLYFIPIKLLYFQEKSYILLYFWEKNSYIFCSCTAWQKWTVRKKFMNYFSKWFSLYVTLPPRDQCQVPIIRFIPNTLTKHQTGCLWWEAVESWFHWDLKSFFALKNNSLGFLLGHITRWINVIYGSWMKWTWHHSKFAVHEVSF